MRMARWALGLLALWGLIAVAQVGGQGLPQMLMYGVYNGAPRALAVDASGNLNISASISGADGTIQDGATPSIEVTVRDYLNSNPLAVAITDANGDLVSSFGGGIQYTEGDTDTTITGTALLFESNTGTSALGVVSSATPLPITGTVTVTDGAGALNVICDSGCAGSGTLGTHGTTLGTITSVTGGVLMGNASTATPTDVGADGDAAAFWLTRNGALNVADGGGSLTVDGTVTVTDGAGALNIICDSGCSGSGASHTDDATFTAATDDGVPIFGFYNNSTPDSVNEGDAGAVRMSANRNLFINIRDAAGNERGLNIDANGRAGVVLYDSTGAELTQDTRGTHGTSLGTITSVTGGVLVGNASTATPTDVGADGDAAVFWLTRNGALNIADAGGSLTVDGTVTVTDGAGALNVICDSGCAGSGTLGTHGTSLGTITSVTGGVLMGNASTATPTDVGADGDAAAFWLTRNGALNVADAGGSLTVDGTVTVTDGAGALNVICDSGCAGSGTLGTHGTTLGTITSVTGGVLMGNASTATPTDVGADGDAAAFWLTRNGALNIADAGGSLTVDYATTGSGTATGALRVELANNGTGALSTLTSLTQFNGNAISTNNGTAGAGVLRVAIASDNSAVSGLGIGATGSAPPANANYISGLASGATGGLTQGIPVCDQQAFLNMTTATTTEIVPLTASRTVHICHIRANANGTTTMTFQRGTGTNCGTGTTAIDAGYNLTAQVGFAAGSGFGEVLSGSSAGNAVCVTNSAAVNLQVFVRYAVY